MKKSTVIQQNEASKEKKVIKVGVYEYEPYLMVDEKGQISGYYKDLMDMLEKKHHLEYEFIIDTLDEGIKKLVGHEIDILLGIPMSIQGSRDILFNRYSTNQELLGVFSNTEVDFEALREITGLTLGMVQSDFNAKIVIDLLRVNGIQIMIRYEKDYKTLEKLLQEGTIDLMVANKWKQKEYHLLYEFIGRDVYIAGHEESREILDTLDEAMESIGQYDKNAMTNLRNKYFGEKKIEYKNIFIGSSMISVVTLTFCVYPYIKKKITRYKIKVQLSKERYVLHYQPIYNPRRNRIVGFEGLLRLLDSNNQLVPPSKFIREIEENEILFDVSLWGIKKVIKDYDAIKRQFELEENPFYVSINISLKEIENENFVNQAIDILKSSQIGNRKICLEIIERFKISDEGKIITHIKHLKEAGFRIAIDDFGVEYSNLDIFQKLDVDIIKVDKMLVEGIGKDALKEEIVLFISKLAYLGDRCVVLEGVEEAYQDTKIKEIENDKLYVQGYYYNKPMSIETN